MSTMTLREFVRYMTRRRFKGFVFALNIVSMSLLGLRAIWSDVFFWPWWVCFVVWLPLAGVDFIQGRRERIELEADRKQLKFWEDEVNRQARELAIMIITGEVGVAVRSSGTSADEAWASAEVRGLQVESLLEGIRTSLARMSREADLSWKKWEARGVVSKTDLEKFKHGQKKQTEE